MYVSIEPVLFTDPQQAVPAGYCRKCGGALWLPSLRCLRCEKEGKHDSA
jgi:hypothetical protein